MSKNISTINNATAPAIAIFSQLGIATPSLNDQFSLTYKDGLLKANVQLASGQTQTAIAHVSGGFNQITTCNSSQMNRQDRNNLIKQLHGNGTKQADIGEQFRLTQSMVSKIINN